MKNTGLIALQFILLPVLLIANIGTAPPARAAGCTNGETRWNIAGKAGEVNLIHSLPSRQLPAVSQGRNPSLRAGVTASRFTYRIHVVVSTVPENPRCFQLQQVNIEYRLVSPIRVYIASEFKEGTCPYRVTLDHETRHVKIARTNLKEMVDSTRKNLPTLLTHTSIQARSLDNAERIFFDAIVRIAGDISRQFRDKSRRENKLMDTPEAYRQDRSKCPEREWQAPFRTHQPKKKR